ncbi:MAG: Ppx/GppA family phosphatase, partial [Betaproteobacteria bacterium]|nr:Ppx/GppA family phosphatase [Betaproteobacteria bacterium]
MSREEASSGELPELVAAVDLGSNSFHLLIGRVEQTPVGPQIFPLDSLRENVRLASGLSADKRLDAASQTRAIAALSRFSERLRAVHPHHVRAVATNTFRIAKNGPDLMRSCEAALGFPIEVIAGKEEARLIYNGVAHTLAADGSRRLVVDIGGGSTEFIIGTDYTPELLESVFVGCIRFSRDYFPGGEITRSGFKEAVLEARREIQVISENYRRLGWDQAVGSSGSAKAIADILHNLGDTNHGITRAGMDRIRSQLIKDGVVNSEALPGLKADRIPVFAGGLAIMIAVFEELSIEHMQFSDGALRLGVLYDVLG